MLAGYFMQVAHLEKTGHYLTVKDNQVSYPYINFFFPPPAEKKRKITVNFILNEVHFSELCSTVF